MDGRKFGLAAALREKSFPALPLHVVAQRGTLPKSDGNRASAVRSARAAPQIAALIDQAEAGQMRKILVAAETIEPVERIPA